MKRRHGNALPVARNERQLRFHENAAIVEWDCAVENAHRRDVQGHSFTLEIQKESVAPGKAIILESSPHDSLQLMLPGDCAVVAREVVDRLPVVQIARS